MKLYFNGCSHTFGDELINPQQDSWPDWNLSMISSDCPRGPGGHLLENGHKEIAKKIIEYYNNNL